MIIEYKNELQTWCLHKKEYLLQVYFINLYQQTN